MSGKLFNFLCSQLERKNSRRTIDLSVNLIFRRIHVYQNGHVPIYRFPSVFFIFFLKWSFLCWQMAQHIKPQTGLTGLSALKLCYGKNISYTKFNFLNHFSFKNNFVCFLLYVRFYFFTISKRRKAAYHRFFAKTLKLYII